RDRNSRRNCNRNSKENAVNFDELYPSKFLRAEDLAGAPLPVTITGVSVEEIGGEKKVVMRFAKVERALITNKTNGKTVRKLYGPDTDEWIGKRITLVPTVVDFKGDAVDAIRIRPTALPTAKKPAPQPAPEPEFNDDVPFPGDDIEAS